MVDVHRWGNDLSIHLRVHWQQEHISITDLLRLLPCLTSLLYLWSVSDQPEHACWGKPVTGWRPKCTECSIYFTSIIFSQGNLICSIWRADEVEGNSNTFVLLKDALVCSLCTKLMVEDGWSLEHASPKTIYYHCSLKCMCKNSLISYFSPLEEVVLIWDACSCMYLLVPDRPEKPMW